jgi:hypothetical protein
VDSEVTPQPVVTTMDAGLYRKNVMLTLSVKPAKLGLLTTGRNTERTNVEHAITGFTTEALELLKAMRPFVLGVQLNKIDLWGPDGPGIELGDGGYYLGVLCKTLKLKAFSAKKKVKLESTITAALLDYLDCAEALSSLGKKMYYGPKMIEVEKEVKNPATGEVSKKLVSVVDKEAEKAAWEARREQMKLIVPRACELHAMLCLAILGTTTGAVNLANIKKLALRYPNAAFEYVGPEKKDPEAEAGVAQDPSAAVHAPA